jgi:hypothetical protein
MARLNAERAPTGRYCYSKARSLAFIDRAKLAYDRDLALIQPTPESANVII